MSHTEFTAAFAPQLIISKPAAAIEFYKKAFSATELRRWSNEDGSVHVAELSFQGSVFHIREESAKQSRLSPVTTGGNTVIIGIFVHDVDSITDRGVEAGAILLSPPQDYDYGYRQASLQDPFGHQWLIQMRI